jgi:sigma-B regulation protein RsbU (phosphoserine phosphatase)
MRADGTVEWLNPTGTILGAFEQWDGTQGEVRLAPGDLLVIYSDGLVEAGNLENKQFGSEGLLRSVLKNHEASLPTLLDSILAGAQEFGDSSHQDDLTVILARIQ